MVQPNIMKRNNFIYYCFITITKTLYNTLCLDTVLHCLLVNEDQLIFKQWNSRLICCVISCAQIVEKRFSSTCIHIHLLHWHEFMGSPARPVSCFLDYCNAFDYSRCGKWYETWMSEKTWHFGKKSVCLQHSLCMCWQRTILRYYFAGTARRNGWQLWWAVAYMFTYF